MRRALKRAAWGLGGLALVGIAAVAIFIALPLAPALLDRGAVASVRFTDRNGVTLRELRSREDGRSVPLEKETVPPLLKAAFLAAEDKRFDSHLGIDPIAIARAVVQDVRARRIVSGASTLTQQLSRELMPRERTLFGKIHEALWALRLTAHLPRERILLEHLNRVPLGNSLYGVEAASEMYFGRPAAKLSAGQAALLAGMARSPARFDPYRHLDRAQLRMAEVLRAMASLEMLTPDELRVAGAAPLDLVPPSRIFKAPHLLSHLAGALPRLGLDRAALIETTLDAALQGDVELAIREEIAGLVKRRVSQAAAIVIDNESGEVLAYVGSANFLDERRGGQNDGIRALRQPGSALKPFAYGLGLSSGKTPASVLSDVETHMSTPTGDYVPRNYDRRVHGPVRLRAALANSYNVPAVNLTEELGPERVIEVMRRAGLETLSKDAAHYGVGVVLGNGDVTLRDLARAYRGLARGGVVGPLSEIRRASDAGGAELPLQKELTPRRFLRSDAVALLTDILSDEGARAPAFGLDNSLRLPFPVAAKTGTSHAYVDNWTVGYTRERTVGIWVGNFDGEPMRAVSGITGAGPLFKRIMIRAMRGLRPAPLVDRSRFDEADICPLSGQRAGPSCPGLLHERFLKGTAPPEPCPMHRSELAGATSRTFLDVGPRFYAWARGEGIESHPSSLAPATGGKARLLVPGDGDEYMLEAGPSQEQTIPLRALAPAGITALEVRTEDGERRTLLAPFVLHLPARRGERRVELWSPGGTEPLAVARYVVR